MGEEVKPPVGYSTYTEAIEKLGWTYKTLREKLETNTYGLEWEKPEGPDARRLIKTDLIDKVFWSQARGDIPFPLDFTVPKVRVPDTGPPGYYTYAEAAEKLGWAYSTLKGYLAVHAWRL